MLQITGVKHQVLNAKQHAKEAAIIAQAGRVGAVTIATNMAGRGTDIVLGGNFEIMANNKLLADGIAPDTLPLEEKRQKYAKLHEELREEQKTVLELGGLHVIGTERHESRRIDNQLRGRAGRQGDPGSSKFFLSIDDDLMRIFGAETIRNVMNRLGSPDGEAIGHRWLNSSIAGMQKKVEGQNFDVRKHLKEYDDVMNLQRREIYGLRRRILLGEDLKDEILEQIAGAVEDTVLKYAPTRSYSEHWNIAGLCEEAMTSFGVPYKISEEEIESKQQDDIFDEIWDLVKANHEDKEARYGADPMRRFERAVFLMVIDSLWKDHLFEMDHLRDSVQFRAYGQKNPLYEYQREALKMFKELRVAIAKAVSGYLFRLEQAAPSAGAQANHGNTNVSASGPTSTSPTDGKPKKTYVKYF